MIALVTAVFLASLLGSLHCAGMCGGFMAFAVYTPTIHGQPVRTRPSRFTLLALYNTGRLITYTSLGAIAGAVGAAVDLGGTAVGLQRLAAIIAGVMIALFGAAMLASTRGVHVPRCSAPAPLRNIVQRGHKAAMRVGPGSRAMIVGLLTTLLPCGWLYAFAISAAGTASPPLGALTMATFWLGTLPVMVSLGVGVQKLAGTMGRRLPTITAAVLIIVGLGMVVSRAGAPAMSSINASASADVLSTEHIMSLPQAEMPCCDAP